MRNLKRTLSLLLAAMMLIGLMVTGASAANVYDNFSDKDEIVNKDAVSLLTILEVIEGQDDGSYNPSRNVTRGEMAKMISVILNKGVDNGNLYTDLATGLTDVAGRWDTGYINYCYTRNIIAGRGNGTFDPEATVTAAEAAKMLLVAAGYNPEIEGYTGAAWAVNVNARASALGLYDDYKGQVMAPLNRDDAALLIYNALDIEMIESYTTNNYAQVYNDRRTILGEMYGVFKLEGVVVANEWAQLENTDSDGVIQTGKTRLSDIRVYESNTLGTLTGNSGERYTTYEDATFSVETPVSYMGKAVTMYIRKTTVLANSEVLGVVLNENVNVIKASTATEKTLSDYLKGTGVSVDRDTEYYVNYGYMGNGANNSNGGSAAIAAINEHPNRDLDKNNEYFNVNGVSLEVIDNDNDGVAEYVLYLQETLSEINRYNEKSETVTFYQPARDSAKVLTGNARTVTRDFEDVVFAEDVADDDLILYVEYGGRTYIHLADYVTGVMSRVDRDKDDELYITVEGEEYRQSYIPDAASMVDVDLTHFVIDSARSNDMVGFTNEYDFILDSTGEYVVAVRPTEVKENNYALVLDSAWTLNALKRDGQVKILKADGTEATYDLDWSDSAKAFKDITNINNTDVPAGTSNDAKLERYLGTRDVNQEGTGTGSATYDKTGLATGSVIRYSIDSNDKLTIDWVMQGNTWKNTAGLEISETVNTKTTAGVGDNGKILYLGTNPTNDNLQYNVNAEYKNGSGTLSVKGVPTGAAGSDATNRSGMTKPYAIDLNTVAFYYWVDDGKLKFGAATGWDDMSTVAVDTDAQVYPVLEKSANRTYKATNLAEVVLFEAVLDNDSANYMLVLNANAASKDTWELNVVFEDGTVDAIIVDDDDLGGFNPDNPYHFMRAWSYTKNASNTYKVGNMYEGNDTESYVGVELSDYRGISHLLENGTVAFASEMGGDKYIALSGRASVWDVTDAERKGDSAPAGRFTRTNVNSMLILDNGAIRTAWIWDIPGQADPTDPVYGWNDVIEYATGKLLVQHYDEMLTAYQVSTLIRDYLHETNSHVTTVTYDAGTHSARVEYDNSTNIDIYDVTLDRVYAYNVRVPSGASLAINGVTYRNGDTAYLGSVDPRTGAAGSYDFTVAAKDTVLVSGNTIAAANSPTGNGNLTITDVVNPDTVGTITVVSGKTAFVPETPEDANDILGTGGKVEMEGEIPDGGNEADPSYDSILNMIDGNGNDTGASLVLKDTAVGAGKKLLINGTATVEGALTIPGDAGTMVEALELNLARGGYIAQSNGSTLALGGLSIKAGSGYLNPGALGMIFDYDIYIDFVNNQITVDDQGTVVTLSFAGGMEAALNELNTATDSGSTTKDYGRWASPADFLAVMGS